MHKLIESAIEAASHGDKNKAMEFLKQALTANPKDTEAMLLLAKLVDEPTRRRQVLNRLLTVDPVNLLARDELLKLDRQDMGAFRSEIAMPTLYRPTAIPSPAAPPKKAESQTPVPIERPAAPRSLAQDSSANHPTTQPVRVKNLFDHWVVESPTVKPQVAVELDSYSIIEKPLVFKYPPLRRTVIYSFVAFFGCVGLLVASQNVLNSLPFLALAALMGIIAMAFSPIVEVSEAGIRASGMLSSSEIRWEEIATIRSMPMKRRLELSGADGKLVDVSTQVSGYPRIVEIIRQRRPDLFGASSSSRLQNNPFAVRHGKADSATSFTETKIFKKSFFAQYGIFFLMFPIFLVGVWAITAKDMFLGIGLCLVSVLFMSMSLFNFYQIRLEPNKLSIESFFTQKQFTAKQIKEISMKTVRSRRGTARNFIHIQPVEGTAIALAGFAQGDEILYGTLVNWWEFYHDE
jgi:hypothetical protein